MFMSLWKVGLVWGLCWKTCCPPMQASTELRLTPCRYGGLLLHQSFPLWQQILECWRLSFLDIHLQHQIFVAGVCRLPCTPSGDELTHPKAAAWVLLTEAWCLLRPILCLRLRLRLRLRRSGLRLRLRLCLCWSISGHHSDSIVLVDTPTPSDEQRSKASSQRSQASKEAGRSQCGHPW